MNGKFPLLILYGALLTGCAPAATVAMGAGAYGGASAIADPPPDAETALKNVGNDVQAGAAEAVQHANYFGSAAKDGFYQMTDHVADWMRPTVPKPPTPIAASYCYHVYQDIVCYRRPMPGWENRLAGYQPQMADPPPAAVMKPLPVSAKNASQSPDNRVAAAKPVFAQAPQPAAQKPADDTANSEASHEQLPDPLSPQL